MYALEMFARAIRRSAIAARLNWFWNLITPFYEFVLRVLFKNGLRRNINHTDVVLVSHRLRYFTESYEPEAWKWLMSQVHEGDCIADIGAYIGLYAIVLARRTGKNGEVFAFEPDCHSLALFKENVKLNKVGPELKIIESAVGDSDGEVVYHSRDCSISSVVSSAEKEAAKDLIKVKSQTLDAFFGDKRLDILKIDVEGYEMNVLRGARRLLSRQSGYPRAILLEVHPYAWEGYGIRKNEVVELLRGAGYTVQDTSGTRIDTIEKYGHITAIKG